MASRIVTKFIVEIGRKAYAIIRRGRLVPTILGTILGGALGGSRALVVAFEFVPALVVLGLIAGATLTAASFQRPLAALGLRAEDSEPFQTGAILQTWKFEPGDADTLIVLFEKALYVVQDDSTPWSEVIDKLSRGVAPELSGECIIRLNDLLGVETASRAPLPGSELVLPQLRTN